MPDYRIYLHDGPETQPLVEIVEAGDDAEAVVLGEMRLLLSSAFTHAVVSLNGSNVAFLKRDSQKSLDELAARANAGRAL